MDADFIVKQHDQANISIFWYNQQTIHIYVAQFQAISQKSEVKTMASTWHIQNSWIYIKQLPLNPLCLPFILEPLSQPCPLMSSICRPKDLMESTNTIP
jgi:hypothetical protein